MAQENRQKRQQAMAAKIPVKVKEDQPWFARFKHLAKGLYNLDSTNTGKRWGIRTSLYMPVDNKCNVLQMQRVITLDLLLLHCEYRAKFCCSALLYTKNPFVHA